MAQVFRTHRSLYTQLKHLRAAALAAAAAAAAAAEAVGQHQS